MMSNRSTDILFQLIKSLEKAEKRHFKLYIKRSSGKEELVEIAILRWVYRESISTAGRI